MKRVDLTSEQLENVIKHRQMGLSWLRVEKATGTSRRVAQRSYEQWQRARSIRELENVRVRVGEIEFEGHIDVITRLAQHLVEHLAVPDYPSFSRDAGAHFTSLMETEIAVVRPEALWTPKAVSTASEARVKARNVRRNRLLLESLKQHTADTFPWDSLKGWMEGWDTCCRVFPGVRTLIGGVINDTFSQFPDVDKWFVIKNKERKPLAILEEGTQDVLWQGIVAGEAAVARNMIYSEGVELKEMKALQITVGLRSLTQREHRDMVPSFVDLCHRVIKDLWDSNEVKEVTGAVEKMRVVVEELEAVLEPLVLRPQILRTRCKLCPA